MEEPTRRFKPWEELDITDDFIFTRVMRNKWLCRTLLEMILKVKIGRIKFLTSHHSLQIEPNAKGIIMDVYLRDKNKVINVEMQASNHGDLAQRARYYQAAADIDTTPKGSKYRDLRQNYVVFICTFDPFGKGKPIYNFKNYCIHYDIPIPLEDGTEKIFLNTSSKDTGSLDGELRFFYDYVRERTVRTAFTKELDSSITKLKQNQEERRMSLLYASRMMEFRQDGYEEGLHTGLFTGREEGISIGLERGAYQKALETARSLLDYGDAPEKVALCTDLPLELVQQLAQETVK
ncbi:MAG: Rpn family recombination-promoting nuclease/putative transposase [Spirochaetaceae bacterium]|nr:Rpn family recombination-promoting nuclease/putative transposase [Spirochaetaceae bacterium]MBQ8561718.1 Rpn family recombination-promoting nuclease/putative transposase [Spirochaetaceae bacterium]